MQVSNADAQLILYGELDGWKEVERTHIDESRWSQIYKIIFEHDGKYFSVGASFGSTESQDDTPPFGMGDPVEFCEVHQVPKTVMIWETVCRRDDTGRLTCK